jgi:hypothetical protein
MNLPLLLSTFLTLCYTQAVSQDGQEGSYRISVTPARLTVPKGCSDSVVLYVTRSKPFRTGLAEFGLSSPTREGVLVTFRPIGRDSCMVRIMATQQAAAGSITLLPNCTLKRRRIAAPLTVSITETVEP